MLFLNIESYHKNATEHPASMQLEEGALTIGRDPANNWCLPDPGRVLSKQHCLIEKHNQQYRLTDTSTNGVFVNDSAEPLGRGNSIELQSGDTIRLSDYELSVNIQLTQPAELSIPASQPVNPAVAQQSAPPPVTPYQARSVAPPPPPITSDSEDDWKSILEQKQPKPDTAQQQVAEQAVDVPEFTQTHYDAPSVGMQIPENWGQDQGSSEGSGEALAGLQAPTVGQGAANGVIPDDFMDSPSQQTDPSGDSRVTVSDSGESPVPEPLVPVQPNQGANISDSVGKQSVEPFGTSIPQTGSLPGEAGNKERTKSAGAPDEQLLMSAFLKGAGLDPNLQLTQSPEQVMGEVGSLLRKVTMGLMGVLAARGDIKSEFRLSQTMIKPTENNPLKFSLNIDEAMVALLTKKGQGYMTADAAFEEAFEDLKGHQLAVLTGMQSALKSLLERLDPANIQGQDSEVKGVKKLLGGQKAQYWDDFVLLYKTLFQKTEDDFQTVFGHEFAKAYEEQIRKQKSRD